MLLSGGPSRQTTGRAYPAIRVVGNDPRPRVPPLTPPRKGGPVHGSALLLGSYRRPLVPMPASAVVGQAPRCRRGWRPLVPTPGPRARRVRAGHPPWRARSGKAASSRDPDRDRRLVAARAPAAFYCPSPAVCRPWFTAFPMTMRSCFRPDLQRNGFSSCQGPARHGDSTARTADLRVAADDTAYVPGRLGLAATTARPRRRSPARHIPGGRRAPCHRALAGGGVRLGGLSYRTSGTAPERTSMPSSSERVPDVPAPSGPYCASSRDDLV